MFIYLQYEHEYADSFLEACLDYHDAAFSEWKFDEDIAHSFFGW